MGQRTATLVTYIDENGKKTNNIYYNQWGIGRVQLMSLMGNFLAQMGEPTFDLSGSKNMSLENEDFEDIDGYDFTKIEHVADVCNNLDNNNGCTVMIVNDNDGSVQIGFCLGDEEVYGTDEMAFSRFVSFEEWTEKVGGKYVNNSFKIMFYGFLEHFKVKTLI